MTLAHLNRVRQQVDAGTYLTHHKLVVTVDRVLAELELMGSSADEGPAPCRECGAPAEIDGLCWDCFGR